MNEARKCGGCAWWSQPRDGYNYGICGFPVLLPVTVLKADWNLTLASGGDGCSAFKACAPLSAPAELQTNTCGTCKWWKPWKIDATTGACDFPILMPASRTYPVDKTPMHETEGDDCQCFERKEG